MRKNFDVTYRDQTINNTTVYKYLGVKLDQTLLLNDHLNSTYKKASGRLYLLGRVRNKLNVKASLAIYTSFVLPLFTYCSITTCYSTNTYKEKLKNMELRARKIISKRSDVNLQSRVRQILVRAYVLTSHFVYRTKNISFTYAVVHRKVQCSVRLIYYIWLKRLSWLQTKGTHHLKGHSKPTKRAREQEEVTGAKKSKV